MNTLNVMVGNAMMYAGAGGGASIGKFIQSMGTNIGSWVKMIVMIIGVIMVGAGIYQVAKNLISHGKGQTNWIVGALSRISVKLVKIHWIKQLKVMLKMLV